MEQVSRREVLRRIGRGAIGLMGGVGVLAEDSIRAEDVKRRSVDASMPSPNPNFDPAKRS
jgi:hypothetical protein